MLQAIQNFFDARLSPELESDSEHSIQLATTALFIEMMLQDEKEHPQEKETILKAIQSCLSV